MTIFGFIGWLFAVWCGYRAGLQMGRLRECKVWLATCKLATTQMDQAVRDGKMDPKESFAFGMVIHEMARERIKWEW